MAYRADTKVYAYTASGDRDPSAEFDLHGDNAHPRGIAHFNGQFYVTDGVDRKVYAYAASGARNPAAEFDLHADNGQPAGIAYAMGRFHVVDWRDDMVYAYTASGARDGTADFNLRDDLGGNQGYGIAYGNDGFYVVDSDSVVSGPGNTDTVRFYPAPSDGTAAQPDPEPDLAVESVSVSDSSPSAGQSFTLNATVLNGGDASSPATTLRYYRSTNATISTSDTEVGTDAVGALAASGSSAESISLTAPSSAGTYYYGACADSVAGESETANNCSSGVRVEVAGGGVSIPGHPSVTHRFSPSELVVGQRAQFILDWNEVPGATSYEVRVDDFPIIYTRRSDGSCSVPQSVTTRDTSYTHEFTASFINQYYAIVQACNSAGCSCPP